MHTIFPTDIISVETVNLLMKQNNTRNSISLHIFVKKFFWFRSVPQNTNTRVGIGTFRNKTEPFKYEINTALNLFLE